MTAGLSIPEWRNASPPEKPEVLLIQSPIAFFVYQPLVAVRKSSNSESIRSDVA